MRRTLEIEFKLNQHIGLVAPGARFWVDLNHDGRTDDNERIKDVIQADLTWTARVKLPAATRNICVLTRYIASPGATWTVTASVDGRVVRSFEGPVAQPVSWVVIDVPMQADAA